MWQSTKTSRKLRTFLFETFLITSLPCTIVNVFKGRVLQVERDGCPHVAFRRPCRPDSYFSRCHESILRVGLNRPRGAFRVVFARCGSTLYIQNQRHIRHVEFKLFSNWVPAFNSWEKVLQKVSFSDFSQKSKDRLHSPGVVTWQTSAGAGERRPLCWCWLCVCGPRPLPPRAPAARPGPSSLIPRVLPQLRRKEMNRRSRGLNRRPALYKQNSDNVLIF